MWAILRTREKESTSALAKRLRDRDVRDWYGASLTIGNANHLKQIIHFLDELYPDCQFRIELTNDQQADWQKMSVGLAKKMKWQIDSDGRLGSGQRIKLGERWQVVMKSNPNSTSIKAPLKIWALGPGGSRVELQVEWFSESDRRRKGVALDRAIGRASHKYYRLLKQILPLLGRIYPPSVYGKDWSSKEVQGKLHRHARELTLAGDDHVWLRLSGYDGHS